MPVGKPSKQSIATRKYEAKTGWISKSYKLKQSVAEEFAEACKKAEVSQAGKLMEMMKAFADSVNGTTE